MTTKASAPAEPAPPAQSRAHPPEPDEARMARVHLRLGHLTLARAELEDLLRRELLDATSLAVLAEARWRTGDMAAAAEAALAHLEEGGSDEVAIAIAAEAAASDGRPADAQALMDRLPSADPVTIDALFAGLPRRAFWPVALGGAPAPDGGLDPGAAAPLHEAISRPVANADAADRGTAPSAAHRLERTGGRRIKAQLDPEAELARARAELDTRPDRAFLRLALVLRYDPALARAVLDTLHLRREPAAAILRGDAQRLLGRHLEAEAAFDAAAENLEAS